MTQISIEQHQMLEDLTGKQFTKNGTMRKHQNRTLEQTLKLGLRDPRTARQLQIIDLKKRLQESTGDRPTVEELRLSLEKEGITMSKLEIMIASIGCR